MSVLCVRAVMCRCVENTLHNTGAESFVGIIIEHPGMMVSKDHASLQYIALSIGWPPGFRKFNTEHNTCLKCASLSTNGVVVVAALSDDPVKRCWHTVW